MGDLPAAPANGQPWIRQQQYVVDVVLPCIEQLYSTERQASGRYLLGFSKSSLGALSLFLRHQNDFAAVGVYDNFDLAPSDKSFHEWGLVLSYGDREQFEKLNPKSLIPIAASELKGSGPRIVVMTGNDDYAGVKQLRELLSKYDVPFQTKTLRVMPHDWRGQWLEELVSSITELRSPQLSRNNSVAGRSANSLGIYSYFCPKQISVPSSPAI